MKNPARSNSAKSATITVKVKVSPDLAKAYEKTPAKEKTYIGMEIGETLKYRLIRKNKNTLYRLVPITKPESDAEFRKSGMKLVEIVKKTSKQAKERGMTQKVLDDILNEK